MKVQRQNNQQPKRYDDRAYYLKPNAMLKFDTDCNLKRIQTNE